MWDVVSLHVSLMFYICRQRGSRKRCKNSIVLIAFSLLVLAGFYGIYTGKEEHQARGPSFRIGKVGGLGLQQLPVEFQDRQQKNHDNNNLHQNNIPNELHIEVDKIGGIDTNQEPLFPINHNDHYPGFNKPFKKFPDPIILKPQAIPAQPVESKVEKPRPQVTNNNKINKPVVGDSQKVVQDVKPVYQQKRMNSDQRIHLAVVCCGDRSEETLVMLKTAVLNTQQKLVFHIFAEEELKPGLAQKLKTWPPAFQAKIEFLLHSIQFPKGENPEEWKKMFKTCATQRLFLPDILTDVDSLLYVDTDILFIRPLDAIWSFFKEFNSTHLAALAPEHEIKNIGWYNRFARHPYYGMTGLNSGVMLMNLTRMRAFGWTQKIVPIYREYKMKITWGDQDLINILFNYHPDRVFVYPCEWNFRPDHCMYSNNCLRINDHGVAVIHGNRGVYHNEKQWPFRMIYEAFSNFELGTTPDIHLIQPLQRKMSEPKSINLYCGKTLIQPLVSTLKKAFDEKH